MVSQRGSLDFCCLPAFDSPTIFAKLLDEKKGGEFAILAESDFQVTQKYLELTNILITRFAQKENVFEVIDFMPRYKTEEGEYYQPPEIYRYIRLISGKPVVRFRYDPQLNYGLSETHSILEKHYIKSYTIYPEHESIKTHVPIARYESLYLYTDFDFKKVMDEEPIEIVRDGYFLISYNQKLVGIDPQRVYLEYQRTKVYWLNWVYRTEMLKYNRDEITRSALILKLLMYGKTGAIVAAVTTSLPEILGRERNWDYRFCWIRDASMMLQTLIKLGHYRAAKRFLDFLIDVICTKDEKVQIMYGIRGERNLSETILRHLSGYKGSAPVRIGNAAYSQKQNDIFGILMEIVYLSFKHFEGTLDTNEELWTITRATLKAVEENWQKPDRGIWELRNEPRHFVFSKLLCWVAVDRGLKIAQQLNAKNFFLPWAQLRETIRDEILEKGWNESVGAFTQSYGSEDLDASNLLMHSFGFIEANDPKYVSTVKTTQKNLCVDGLMFRYKNEDDFGLPSSSFTICTLWMIQSLFHIGEKEEAQIGRAHV